MTQPDSPFSEQNAREAAEEDAVLEAEAAERAAEEQEEEGATIRTTAASLEQAGFTGGSQQASTHPQTGAVPPGIKLPAMPGAGGSSAGPRPPAGRKGHERGQWIPCRDAQGKLTGERIYFDGEGGHGRIPGKITPAKLLTMANCIHEAAKHDPRWRKVAATKPSGRKYHNEVNQGLGQYLGSMGGLSQIHAPQGPVSHAKMLAEHRRRGADGGSDLKMIWNRAIRLGDALFGTDATPSIFARKPKASADQGATQPASPADAAADPAEESALHEILKAIFSPSDFTPNNQASPRQASPAPGPSATGP